MLPSAQSRQPQMSLIGRLKSNLIAAQALYLGEAAWAAACAWAPARAPRSAACGAGPAAGSATPATSGSALLRACSRRPGSQSCPAGCPRPARSLPGSRCRPHCGLSEVLPAGCQRRPLRACCPRCRPAGGLCCCWGAALSGRVPGRCRATACRGPPARGARAASYQASAGSLHARHLT